MVGPRREPPPAGELAVRERQRAPAESDSKPLPGVLGFLDGVLGSEAKTRRLAYLFWQFAGGVSLILVTLGAFEYLMTYKSPVELKMGISIGSVAMVITGGIGLLRWRVKRILSASKPPIADQGDEKPAHS